MQSLRIKIANGVARPMQRLYGACTEGAWTYPVRGLYYFMRHSYLWPLLQARLVPCFLLSLFVLFNLFFWTYLPQVAILALFQHSGSAWFNGTILVLGEGAGVVSLLFEAWFIDETQVNIFDAVMVAEGFEDLVSISRPILPAEPGLNPRTRLGLTTSKAVYAPFSLRQIAEFVVLLPLNIIPYIGVPLFLVLTGYRAGPLLHWRYFQLKGWTKKDRKAFIKSHQWEYGWFGTVYLATQLVPIFGMVFLLTTAAGSSLWATKLDNESTSVQSQADEDDVDIEPDRYQDDA